MNKRILDGAGLWKSDKLARIQPLRFRAEYANWIPLALANGVFEADTRRIWATIYSYNRPDVSFEDAEEIKRELCRVGLLFLWPDEETGKSWGFFVGIDKSGRLPSKSRLDKKHEPVGPTPPVDALRSYIELTRSKALESSVVSQWLANGCLGFGFGIGLGSGSGTGSRASHVVSASPADLVETETRQAAFDLFWESWPKKQSKAAALRAWMRIPISEYAAVTAGLSKWLKSDQWSRGVIPHPATWLNNKRWMDEDIPQGGTNGSTKKLTGDVLTTANLRAAGYPVQ